jgi:BirA family biotin operon repressor/biotin-[acetyl-CoA-carboxylase] ligase
MDHLIWRVEHFKEIDSTNSWLAAQARSGAPEGLVAYCDFQSAGRGRLDRQWHAPPRSSLLCSILLRPNLSVDQLQLVVGAVALSIRAALVRLCGLRPGLKWPNDLVVGDEKLAGLLAEIVTTPEGPAAVVGLGLNLTESPQDVAATDVLHETGITLSARGLLDIFLEELEWRYLEILHDHGRVELRREYERALVTLGHTVRVERADGDLVGEALGVDECGRLIVDVEGQEMVFSTGDVVHVRPHLGAPS